MSRSSAAHPPTSDSSRCRWSATRSSASPRRTIRRWDVPGSWLLRESGSGTRALNERFLEEQGIAPQTLTLGSNGAIRQAVRAGLGVSLVSRETVEGEFESGRLGEIRLRDRPPPRTWFVVRSAVGPVREVVREFVAFAAAQRRSSAPTRR